MTIGEGLLLGLVQGLAEFLPISSSGHLAILESVFGIQGEQVLTFAVLLHFGTLISLFFVYYRDIWELLVELILTARDLVTGKGLRLRGNETRTLGVMILVATIPTAFFGLVLNDFFSSLYTSLASIGVGLLITGTILWIVERLKPKQKSFHEMRIRDALLVGLFQSIAIAPGISRSGSTIVGSLVSGLERRHAVRFAFLISIPSILGAFLLEAPDAFQQGLDPNLLLPIALGVIAATISGFLAIKTMIRLVSNQKLRIFSYYTWVVGALVLLYALA